MKYSGKGDALYGNSFTVRNSTLAFNMGQGLYQDSSTASKASSFTDCILWGNGDDIAGYSDNVTLDHCCIDLFDGNTGTGCIHVDPQFDRGFYLADGSPCVDAGSGTASAAGMDSLTTRADGTLDAGIVDLGYHETSGTGASKVDLHVASSGSDTTGDGSSSNPYRSVTKALSVASDWTTIHIGSGSYTAASGEIFPCVLADRMGLSFVGAGAGSTVLDNEWVEGQRVLEVTNCLNVAFSGITFTHGHATETNKVSLYGGGMLIVDCGGIEFSDCVISDNIAALKSFKHFIYTFGGGIASCGTSLQLERCTIQGNIVSNRTAIAFHTWGCGGGLAVIGGLGELVNCKVLQNRADSGSSTKGCTGGGVYNNGGTTWIYDSLVISNTAYAKEWGIRGYGDGVFNSNNDTFSYLLMENCTVADNVSVTNSTGVYNSFSDYYVADADLLNCIVVGHTDDIYNGKTISVSYSCVGTKDSFWSDGVGGCLLWSTGEPLFKWNTVGDYRLADNAVAKNVGDNRYWMDDILDMGGNPRVAYGVVDMGCYENTPPSGTVLSIR